MGLVRCHTVAAMHCLEQLDWDWGWCGLAGAGWAGRGWPQVARPSGAGLGRPAGCESAGMPPQLAALKAAAAAPRPALQHPRDVYLFASDVGLGQRAMLAARGGAILFRTVSAGGAYGSGLQWLSERKGTRHRSLQHPALGLQQGTNTMYRWLTLPCSLALPLLCRQSAKRWCTGTRRCSSHPGQLRCGIVEQLQGGAAAESMHMCQAGWMQQPSS